MVTLVRTGIGAGSIQARCIKETVKARERVIISRENIRYDDRNMSEKFIL